MNLRMLLLLLLPSLSGCNSCSSHPPLTTFGKFEGRVVAEWDDDGRFMTLREQFAYMDPANKRWLAPPGVKVNGASIPQAFWTLIGGPFTGQYRNASVVHDVYCETMSETWEDVHQMFYNACRCGGVSESNAKLMYWAVYHYGPRWEPPKSVSPSSKDGPLRAPAVPQPDEQIVAAAKAYFENNNPSLEDIKQLDPEEVTR